MDLGLWALSWAVASALYAVYRTEIPRPKAQSLKAK
jgi:hypothetical protein